MEQVLFGTDLGLTSPATVTNMQRANSTYPYPSIQLIEPKINPQEAFLWSGRREGTFHKEFSIYCCFP